MEVGRCVNQKRLSGLQEGASASFLFFVFAGFLGEGGGWVGRVGFWGVMWGCWVWQCLGRWVWVGVRVWEFEFCKLFQSGSKGGGSGSGSAM